MLRYKTQARHLVTLYDIRPGNGAGQFLQPRSLHRASSTRSLPSCAGCSESKCNQRLCVRLLTYAHYAPYGGHNASMAVVSLSVCLSVCLFVCLFVRLSVYPLPDPGLRMEGHSIASSIWQEGRPWHAWPVTPFRVRKVKQSPGVGNFATAYSLCFTRTLMSSGRSAYYDLEAESCGCMLKWPLTGGGAYCRTTGCTVCWHWRYLPWIQDIHTWHIYKQFCPF